MFIVSIRAYSNETKNLSIHPINPFSLYGLGQADPTPGN